MRMPFVFDGIGTSGGIESGLPLSCDCLLGPFLGLQNQDGSTDFLGLDGLGGYRPRHRAGRGE